MSDLLAALDQVLATPEAQVLSLDSDADRARLRELVAAEVASVAPLTVNEALRWRYVAEYLAPLRDGEVGERVWCQAVAQSWRYWRATPAVGVARWSTWTRELPAGDLAAPCRIVPIATADDDPATRGPL